MKDTVRLLIVTYFMSLFSFNTNYAIAENFVCGVDGAEYSDTIESTSACLKLDNNENFCPVGATACNQESTEGLDETQCLAVGGVWGEGSEYTVTQESSLAVVGTDRLIIGVNTGLTSYVGFFYSYLFGPKLRGTYKFPDKSSVSGGNIIHDQYGIISYVNLESQSVNWKIEDGAIYYVHPIEFFSYYQTNNTFNIYSISHKDTEEYGYPNLAASSHTINASNAFSFDSFGRPTGETYLSGALIKSTSYFVKVSQASPASNEVIIKGVWTLQKPSSCSMPDGTTTYWTPADGSGESGNICKNINGTYMSQTNTCVDLDSAEDLDGEFDLSGDMLADDGRRDGEGNCIDTMMLFVGRGQSCKTPGVSSAWQNCCSFDGEMMNENVGSLSQIGNYAQAIKGLYDISKAAYAAYSSAVASGASTTAAAGAATSAAGSQAVVAFDPTSLAVAAAVYLVTDFAAKACLDDMNTAAAVASNHCVEVGEFCSKRYKYLGCVQKKKSFCCFNGKMQRIFHEQGRPQLTTFNGFGTPKAPDCRGYTPEEFQALDFSKMDLTEYYEDLNHNTSTEINQSMTEKTNEFYNSVQ